MNSLYDKQIGWIAQTCYFLWLAIQCYLMGLCLCCGRFGVVGLVFVFVLWLIWGGVVGFLVVVVVVLEDSERT